MKTLTYNTGNYSNYYIEEKQVRIPQRKSFKKFWLKIEGWANARMFCVDKKHGFTLFQASSESNGCHRCSICQGRMQLIGWRTGHRFVEVVDYYSLYQKRMGIPQDLTVEGIRAYLGLPVVSM